jgi:hypothetical protein
MDSAESKSGSQNESKASDTDLVAHAIVNYFRNSENSMDKNSNGSAGFLLLRLIAIYIDTVLAKTQAENQDNELKTKNSTKTATAQAKNQLIDRYINQFKDKISKIIRDNSSQISNEKKVQFQAVLTYIDEEICRVSPDEYDHFEVKKKIYQTSPKQVLGLVCAAIFDQRAYPNSASNETEQKHDSDDTSEVQASPTQTLTDRVVSFAEHINAFRLENQELKEIGHRKRCHQGWRLEMLSYLRKTDENSFHYPDTGEPVVFIQDFTAFTVEVITDFFQKKLNQVSAEEQFQIFLNWLTQEQEPQKIAVFLYNNFIHNDHVSKTDDELSDEDKLKDKLYKEIEDRLNKIGIAIDKRTKKIIKENLNRLHLLPPPLTDSIRSIAEPIRNIFRLNPGKYQRIFLGDIAMKNIINAIISLVKKSKTTLSDSEVLARIIKEIITFIENYQRVLQYSQNQILLEKNSNALKTSAITYQEKITALIITVNRLIETANSNKQQPNFKSAIADLDATTHSRITFQQIYAKYNAENCSDTIANFFANYFATDDKIRRGYFFRLLRTREMQQRIQLLDIPLMRLIKERQQSNNEHSNATTIVLFPEDINRILLFALSTSPTKWTPLFYNCFTQVLKFINNTFNAANIRLASELKRSSYPEELLTQLNFLGDIYQHLHSNQRPEQNQAQESNQDQEQNPQSAVFSAIPTACVIPCCLSGVELAEFSQPNSPAARAALNLKLLFDADIFYADIEFLNLTTEPAIFCCDIFSKALSGGVNLTCESILKLLNSFDRSVITNIRTSNNDSLALPDRQKNLFKLILIVNKIKHPHFKDYIKEKLIRKLQNQNPTQLTKELLRTPQSQKLHCINFLFDNQCSDFLSLLGACKHKAEVEIVLEKALSISSQRTTKLEKHQRLLPVQIQQIWQRLTTFSPTEKLTIIKKFEPLTGSTNKTVEMLFGLLSCMTHNEEDFQQILNHINELEKKSDLDEETKNRSASGSCQRIASLATIHPGILLTYFSSVFSDNSEQRIDSLQSLLNNILNHPVNYILLIAACNNTAERELIFKDIKFKESLDAELNNWLSSPTISKKPLEPQALINITQFIIYAWRKQHFQIDNSEAKSPAAECSSSATRMSIAADSLFSLYSTEINNLIKEKTIQLSAADRKIFNTRSVTLRENFKRTGYETSFICVGAFLQILPTLKERLNFIKVSINQALIESTTKENAWFFFDLLIQIFHNPLQPLTEQQNFCQSPHEFFKVLHQQSLHLTYSQIYDSLQKKKILRDFPIHLYTKSKYTDAALFLFAFLVDSKDIAIQKNENSFDFSFPTTNLIIKTTLSNGSKKFLIATVLENSELLNKLIIDYNIYKTTFSSTYHSTNSAALFNLNRQELPLTTITNHLQTFFDIFAKRSEQDSELSSQEDIINPLIFIALNFLYSFTHRQIGNSTEEIESCFNRIKKSVEDVSDVVFMEDREHHEEIDQIVTLCGQKITDKKKALLEQQKSVGCCAFQ